jgi:hypothetical protein
MDLRVAACAFEAACAEVREDTFSLEPHSVRRLLARYVMLRALGGDRNGDSLRDGALEDLRSVPSAPPAVPSVDELELSDRGVVARNAPKQMGDPI